jgi:hypothetical protein
VKVHFINGLLFLKNMALGVKLLALGLPSDWGAAFFVKFSALT